MAECTQPVKPVRSEGHFCLMGQGYIMLYCSVAGPSADTCKKDCICGSPIWKSKVIPSRISITSLPLKCRITELLLRAGLICAS